MGAAGPPISPASAPSPAHVPNIRPGVLAPTPAPCLHSQDLRPPPERGGGGQGRPAARALQGLCHRLHAALPAHPARQVRRRACRRRRRRERPGARRRALESGWGGGCTVAHTAGHPDCHPAAAPGDAASHFFHTLSHPSTTPTTPQGMIWTLPTPTACSAWRRPSGTGPAPSTAAVKAAQRTAVAAAPAAAAAAAATTTSAAAAAGAGRRRRAAAAVGGLAGALAPRRRSHWCRAT
jgi:hypothetical protein